MTLILVIVGVGAVAAGLAYGLSASRTFHQHHHFDPIDPESEERVVRRLIGRRPKLDRFLRERLDRATAGGFMLTACFLIAFAVTLVLGLLLTLIDHSDTLQDVDRSISEWGSEHASDASVDVVKAITHIGATYVAFTYLAAAALFDFVRRRNVEVFLFAASVGLGELLINNGIKLIVDRDRPSVLRLVGAHGSSFPSGHTCAAAACTSAVALILGRDRSRVTRAVLAGLAALVAASVAASRALLGVHWFSDVLAGLALGWGWFLLVAIVFGGRQQKIADPVQPVAQSAPLLHGRSASG